MELKRNSPNENQMIRMPIFFFSLLLLFFSLCAFLSATHFISTVMITPDCRSHISAKAGRMNLQVERRGLGGPGSSPPRCTAKCGKCSPCKAVHVAVPPGTPGTGEYYPEAWRCKCGNKLYMP